MVQENVLISTYFVNEKISELNKKIQTLSAELEYERKLRESAEAKLLTKDNDHISKEKRLVENTKKQERRLCGKKSDGKSLVQFGGSSSISSYDEFLQIGEYLKTHGRYGERDYLAYVFEISSGWRKVDVFSAKWNYIFNDDLSFRKRAYIVEKKTGKISSPIITDIIKTSVTNYLNSTGIKVVLSDNIFKSQKGKSSPEELSKSFSKNLKEASIQCGRKEYENHITSHGLRKTCTRIIMCKYTSSYNFSNSCIINMVLNHSSMETTKAYLPFLTSEQDKAMETVSEFLLGHLGNDLDEPASSAEYLDSVIDEIRNTLGNLNKLKEDTNE